MFRFYPADIVLLDTVVEVKKTLAYQTILSSIYKPYRKHWNLTLAIFYAVCPAFLFVVKTRQLTKLYLQYMSNSYWPNWMGVSSTLAG
jgi:hypothetical protein